VRRGNVFGMRGRDVSRPRRRWYSGHGTRFTPHGALLSKNVAGCASRGSTARP
jgi:hypothetical protein